MKMEMDLSTDELFTIEKALRTKSEQVERPECERLLNIRDKVMSFMTPVEKCPFCSKKLGGYR